MPRSWSFLSPLILLTFITAANAYTGKFDLIMDTQTSNEEKIFIEVHSPSNQKIFALRYQLMALDDAEFTDHLKPAKIIFNQLGIARFSIDRRYLNIGNYVLEVEVDYRKVQMFDWMKFFISGNTKKIYMKFKIDKTIGD